MPVASDRCFPPIEWSDATTLILGSLPGRKSLEMQQYYAHPQNAFWKLVAVIFEADSALPHTRRVRILTGNRIALWDVLAAAERPGILSAVGCSRDWARNSPALTRGFSRPRVRRTRA